jgi:avidin family protein
MTLAGVWKNEYGSIMTLHLAKPNFLIGTYQSSTGSTGTYRVIGYQTNGDPTPSAGQPVSLAINWHSVSPGPPDNSWHWVSGLSGQISIVNGAEQLVLAHSLVASIELPGLVQNGTHIDKLTYQRVSSARLARHENSLADRARYLWDRTLGPKTAVNPMVGSWVAGDGTALSIESLIPHVADVLGLISGKLAWKGSSSLFQGLVDIKALSAGLTQAVAIVGLPNRTRGPAIALAGTLDCSSGLLELLALESRSTAPGSIYVQTSVSSKVFSKSGSPE